MAACPASSPPDLSTKSSSTLLARGHARDFNSLFTACPAMRENSAREEKH